MSNSLYILIHIKEAVLNFQCLPFTVRASLSTLSMQGVRAPCRSEPLKPAVLLQAPLHPGVQPVSLCLAVSSFRAWFALVCTSQRRHASCRLTKRWRNLCIKISQTLVQMFHKKNQLLAKPQKNVIPFYSTLISIYERISLIYITSFYMLLSMLCPCNQIMQ